MKEAGFQEESLGEDAPPVSNYMLGKGDHGFYVEFVVPLTGSGYRRDGVPEVTVRKAGVTAQKLRHLELLLVEPWIVRLGGDSAAPLIAPADVKLANPVSCIAQKLLIQKWRTPDKQAQDVIYIHDTLELFGGNLELLREVWLRTIRPRLPEKVEKAVLEASHSRFAVVTDVVRSAARLPQDRVLQPELVRALCALGLGEIFGTE